jgi:hypothetical protein
VPCTQHGCATMTGISDIQVEVEQSCNDCDS